MARTFVAVWPPTAVIDELAALTVPDGVRRTKPENMHVTLAFLGDVADPAAVVDALAGRRWDPVEVAVGPRLAWLGRGVLVVPVSGLDQWAAQVADALGQRRDRPFRGHLTVARTRSRRQPPVDVPVEHHFRARSVAVVVSELGPNGATYTTVATVPTPGLSRRGD